MLGSKTLKTASEAAKARKKEASSAGHYGPEVELAKEGAGNERLATRVKDWKVKIPSATKQRELSINVNQKERIRENSKAKFKRITVWKRKLAQFSQ